MLLIAFAGITSSLCAPVFIGVHPMVALSGTRVESQSTASLDNGTQLKALSTI